MPPGPASQLLNKANCLFGAYQKDAEVAHWRAHYFDADAKFFFLTSPDLKLIKLVTDETLLLENQVLYVVVLSVGN